MNPAEPPYAGSMLPDPDGLLAWQGEMDSPRPYRGGRDLDAPPGVRELVRAAIAQAERPQVKAGSRILPYAGLNPPRRGLPRTGD